MFLETRDILLILKIGRNTLNQLITTRGFPEPIIVGKRKRRWREEDVQAWVVTQ